MLRFLFVAMLVSGLAYGQAITGTTGEISDGTSITITGSSFGANGPAVSIFADFEEGTNGDNLFAGTGSANYGEWDVYYAPEGTPSIYSNAHSVSGDLSARFDESGSGFNFLREQFDPVVRELFISYWMYLPEEDYWPGEGYSDGTVNWKTVWLQGTSTSDDDMIFLQIRSNVGSASQIVGNEPDPGYQHYVNPNFISGRWTRISVWMNGSTDSSTADGDCHFWHMNSSNGMILGVNDNDVITLKEGGTWDRVALNGYAYPSDPCHPTFDDFYVSTGDNSRARIEIGDASSYMSCTNMTILRPTSWSATSIVAVVNQGSFVADESAYLFVVDSDGTASAGFAVTIGGEASVELTAPTALTVSGGNP